jgi:hypothetical protein
VKSISQASAKNAQAHPELLVKIKNTVCGYYLFHGIKIATDGLPYGYTDEQTHEKQQKDVCVD